MSRLFDSANYKYHRAQFDEMTTDEWCALVEGHREEAEEAEEALAAANEAA